MRFSVQAAVRRPPDGKPGDGELAIELLASKLWDLGTIGISLSGDGEMVAGFETEAEANTAAEVIAASDPDGFLVVDVQPAATAQDWGDNEVHIVEVAGKQQCFKLAIRAGGAFGHGTHPTTRLILQQLADILHGPPDQPERSEGKLSIEGSAMLGVEGSAMLGVAGLVVLDVGTGSGVLAIAAAKAGVASVVALDNDPAAITVAIENVARNAVTVDCEQTTIGEVLARRSSPFDLILINVLLLVHRELAPSVLEALAPTGTLITAGYLTDQAAAATELYGASTESEPQQATSGLRTVAVAYDDDWCSHRFQRVAAEG